MSSVPPLRIREANRESVQPGGAYVLYWMTAARRVRWNFGLQRAVEWARKLEKPLVVLEALRRDYPWASERFDRFVIDGMRDTARLLVGRNVTYYPYIEAEPRGGRGLLGALAARACVVVTDDYPAFFLPRMVTAAAGRLPVKLEQVDSNGLLPMRTALRRCPTAHSFRAFLQKTLPAHLVQLPGRDPLSRLSLPALSRLPKGIKGRWPPSALPTAGGSGNLTGGAVAAGKRLDGFARTQLRLYDKSRNNPAEDGSSGLSPYLHFGHISSHEIFHKISRTEGWDPEQLGTDTSGRRSGWWGMSPPAEAFLDQLVAWRELGFNACSHSRDYDQYDSLPPWARQTLAEHAGDRRGHLYKLKQFEDAATHDPLWNAAQVQLVREGIIHNYLRMLWGKKILEWSSSPQAALEIMIELNNKYALDGRDPNSYSGIFWVLGRYDRAWGPERPIFGKIRYMSSENTARKLPVREYLEKYRP
jgi:deoxyribodipyrimidine photo-lyase